MRYATRHAPLVLLRMIPLLLGCGCVAPTVKAESDLGAETYIDHHGGTLAPAGTLEIDGRRISCGQYPTVLDPDLHDFAAAPRSFLILNPDRFAGLATPVKLWIFAHECAHQTAGADEVRADCAAVQRGRRERWLNADGLAQVCEFMRPARADRTHFSGEQRCAEMQQCFRNDSKPSRR